MRRRTICSNPTKPFSNVIAAASVPNEACVFARDTPATQGPGDVIAFRIARGRRAVPFPVRRSAGMGFLVRAGRRLISATARPGYSRLPPGTFPGRSCLTAAGQPRSPRLTCRGKARIREGRTSPCAPFFLQLRIRRLRTARAGRQVVIPSRSGCTASSGHCPVEFLICGFSVRSIWRVRFHVCETT